MVSCGLLQPLFCWPLGLLLVSGTFLVSRLLVSWAAVVILCYWFLGLFPSGAFGLWGGFCNPEVAVPMIPHAPGRGCRRAPANDANKGLLVSGAELVSLMLLVSGTVLVYPGFLL